MPLVTVLALFQVPQTHLPTESSYGLGPEDKQIFGFVFCCWWWLFVFRLFETGSLYIDPAGLELTGIPPASVF